MMMAIGDVVPLLLVQPSAEPHLMRSRKDIASQAPFHLVPFGP
jgi:hypothetical protein